MHFEGLCVSSHVFTGTLVVSRKTNLLQEHSQTFSCKLGEGSSSSTHKILFLVELL